MRYPFLSAEWFAKVDELIAAAGDLRIPDAMKAVEVNVTVTRADGNAEVFLKDGLFARGHRPGVATSLTLSEALARKIFLEADAAAGVMAFMQGEMTVEGDLTKLVAMQTTDPSAQQLALTKRIAEITE